MDEHDTRAQTRVRAYHLWENEGRPHGRALDHWLEAERHEQPSPANQASAGDSEGGHAAAREASIAQNAAVRSGPVTRKVRAAKAAAEGAEGRTFKGATRTSRNRGEDPELKR